MRTQVWSDQALPCFLSDPQPGTGKDIAEKRGVCQPLAFPIAYSTALQTSLLTRLYH